jgi:hypothetical protein
MVPSESVFVQTHGKTPTTSRNDRDYVIVNVKKYFSANVHLVEYCGSTRNVVPNPGALIDRGANAAKMVVWPTNPKVDYIGTG